MRAYRDVCGNTYHRSLKVDRLLSCNSDLQMDINTASEQINTSAKINVNATTTPTLSILDELADRERRRKNLIVYNLPENSDRQADKTKFQELSTTVFNLDLSITKVFRLGKRNDDKPRPLLVGLENETEKTEILSQSGKPRRYDQYNDVYIVADKTKYERDKHKKLVDELKLRRSKGEKNLVIRILHQHHDPEYPRINHLVRVLVTHLQDPDAPSLPDDNLTGTVVTVNNNAKQKHLGCKKSARPIRSNMQAGRRDQKL